MSTFSTGSIQFFFSHVQHLIAVSNLETRLTLHNITLRWQLLRPYWHQTPWITTSEQSAHHTKNSNWPMKISWLNHGVIFQVEHTGELNWRKCFIKIIKSCFIASIIILLWMTIPRHKYVYAHMLQSHVSHYLNTQYSQCIRRLVLFSHLSAVANTMR